MSGRLAAFYPAKRHNARIAICTLFRMAQLGAQKRVLCLPLDPQELLQFACIWQCAIVSKVFHGASPKK
jgi:hypothetical protein